MKYIQLYTKGKIKNIRFQFVLNVDTDNSIQKSMRGRAALLNKASQLSVKQKLATGHIAQFYTHGLIIWRKAHETYR